MQLQKAERKQVKLRLNLASPSGFGKTYGALLIAYGITEQWDKIGVVDTENGSCSLYSHLGNFNTVTVRPPFTTERYIQAIKICEDAGMEVIIIDSITHVWKGQGGLLEYQSSFGGRYQDWAKATPLYQNWLNTILQSKCHIITTNRKKQGYNMITDGNRTKVEKAGLDDEIRDGYEYEMTVALEIINDKHLARASKDRTQLFADKPEFIIGISTGKLIREWCNTGLQAADEKDADLLYREISSRIGECTSMEQLLSFYLVQQPNTKEKYAEMFTKKKQQLTTAVPNQSILIVNQIKPSTNGTFTN